ncbi:ATP synthase F1 subunit epsilon [Clostridium sp.]|uniref:ATP synthase F1 subunit epsilon n=1 Tax=Clostridium sp. TaxID=1506 RepID=UPI003F3A6312
MSKSLKLEIITPGKDPIEKSIEAIRIKTTNGEVEIRSNHTAIIISTIPAPTIITNEDGSKERVFTSAGVVYVKNNEVKFCCDAMENSSDIDKTRAEDALKRAEKRLSESKDIDVERAKMALARANARIETISINQ